jgi:hypothetical protein
MATVFIGCLFAGFPSLYATLVCVACSLLEKLRLALLDIRQTPGLSEQECGDATDQQETRGQKNIPSEPFHHMQEQLNKCIRHHQEIKRLGLNQRLIKLKVMLLFQISRGLVRSFASGASNTMPAPNRNYELKVTAIIYITLFYLAQQFKIF